MQQFLCIQWALPVPFVCICAFSKAYFGTSQSHLVRSIDFVLLATCGAIFFSLPFSSSVPFAFCVSHGFVPLNVSLYCLPCETMHLWHLQNTVLRCHCVSACISSFCGPAKVSFNILFVVQVFYLCFLVCTKNMAWLQTTATTAVPVYRYRASWDSKIKAEKKWKTKNESGILFILILFLSCNSPLHLTCAML